MNDDGWMDGSRRLFGNAAGKRKMDALESLGRLIPSDGNPPLNRNARIVKIDELYDNSRNGLEWMNA